jgi:hypothetical protein
VKEALKVDSMTGTDFWKKAIDKEMRNVKPAFEFRDDNNVPIQYKHIDCINHNVSKDNNAQEHSLQQS